MKNTMKSLKEIKTEMKKINKILIAFSLVFAMSCDTESLLTEESISNQTAGAYFSTPSGFEDLTVAEFVKFSAASHGLSGAEYKQAVIMVAEDLELKSLSRSRLADLSKGLRQRVWLAQALVHDPDILFLDEPTDGLDPIQKVALRRYILEIAKNKIVIMSTHVLEEAEAMCGRLLIMNNGHIVKDGSTNDFLDAAGQLESSIIEYAS